MKAIVRMYAIDAAILFALLVLQITFGTLISIEGVGPDFMMIWLVVIALRSGQLPATLFGFASGLALDLYAGELVGLSALAVMTVSGMSIGAAKVPATKTPARLVRLGKVLLVAQKPNRSSSTPTAWASLALLFEGQSPTLKTTRSNSSSLAFPSSAT